MPIGLLFLRSDITKQYKYIHPHLLDSLVQKFRQEWKGEGLKNKTSVK